MDHNYTPTQKKYIRYTFASSIDDFRPTQRDKTISFFFQIATFKNEYNKYHMRKFIVDSDNKFINIEDYMLNRNQCKKFYKIKKQHHYRMYNTKTLDGIDPPTLNDIHTSKSHNLTDCNNNLDTMYNSFTMDNVDYSKLHEKKILSQITDIDEYHSNNNIISDYSKF